MMQRANTGGMFAATAKEVDALANSLYEILSDNKTPHYSFEYFIRQTNIDKLLNSSYAPEALKKLIIDGHANLSNRYRMTFLHTFIYLGRLDLANQLLTSETFKKVSFPVLIPWDMTYLFGTPLDMLLEKFSEYDSGQVTASIKLLELMLHRGAIVPTYFEQNIFRFTREEEMLSEELLLLVIKKSKDDETNEKIKICKQKIAERDQREQEFKKKNPLIRPPIQTHSSLRACLYAYLSGVYGNHPHKRTDLEIAEMLALFKHYGAPVDRLLGNLLTSYSKTRTAEQLEKEYKDNYPRERQTCTSEEMAQRVLASRARAVSAITKLQELMTMHQSFKPVPTEIDPEARLTGMEKAWENSDIRALPAYSLGAFSSSFGSCC